MTPALNTLYDQCAISTHTPVRVWPFNVSTWKYSIIFQLTHPWGCDLPNSLYISVSLPFQLTHPWGCDIDMPQISADDLFQLTHPWGCDPGTSIREIHHKSFQLTHPWGCDLFHFWDKFYCIANFNSHTREGVTLKPISILVNARSISTHTPVRVWLSGKAYSFSCQNFNSHTREGVTISAPQ